MKFFQKKKPDAKPSPSAEISAMETRIQKADKDNEILKQQNSHLNNYITQLTEENEEL